VDELAGMAALVAVGGSSGSSRDRLRSPIRFSQRETVESGSSSTSAISAAVIRSLRSRSIASTRACGSRRGERRGREQRSSNSRSPAR
jgi:hypothetical protein